jgi:hypothetical protein
MSCQQRTFSKDAYPIAKPNEENLGAAHDIVVRQMLQAWTWSNQNCIQPCGGNHCDDVDVGKWREIGASRRLAGLLELESGNAWSELASQCCGRYQHKDLQQSQQGMVNAALDARRGEKQNAAASYAVAG